MPNLHTSSHNSFHADELNILSNAASLKKKSESNKRKKQLASIAKTPLQQARKKKYAKTNAGRNIGKSIALDDFEENAYLTSNLIAYIGNKRRLLPLLDKAIQEITKNGSVALREGGIFIDYFSGTGVVGRLAVARGFRVVANDWEDYAAVLARAFLCSDASVLKGFKKHGGFLKLISILNCITKATPMQNCDDLAKKIISTLYSPKLLKANPDEERMFYTPENGLLIDNIRHFISQHYDQVLENKSTSRNREQLKKERDLLLALLIVQASKRSNTSGVFKAYHHGFGGRKQDALTRIMHKVQLEIPMLMPAKKLKDNKVFKKDALYLAKKLQRVEAEIVYLDPPYNQHQYGSNYHILNTIVKWDDPGVSKKIQTVAGRSKGGIRQDWKKTRSNFCSKKTALAEFATMVETVHAKYLMISYSTEGMIDFEQLIAVLQKKGRLAIVTAPYVRYRGGRQSNATAKKNVEFVLIVDTSLPCRISDVNNVRGVLISAKLQSTFEENLPMLPLMKYNGQSAVHARSLSGKNFLAAKGLFADDNMSKLWELHLPKKSGPAGRSFKLFHKPTNKYIQLNARLQIEKQLIELSMKELAAMNDDLLRLFAKPNHEKIAGILQALFADESCLDKKFLLTEAFRLAEKINAVKTPREYHAMLQWLQEFKKREESVNSTRYVEVLQTKVRNLELKMESLLVDRIFAQLFA